MTRTAVFLTAFIYMACTGSETRQATHIYNIDSLINAQVSTLNVGNHRLSKKATIGSQTTTVELVPDSTGWADELAVFRQLDVVERPINRDRYSLEEQRDINSNLRIRQFQAQGTPLPTVPLIRFYYLDDISDLRRIESKYLENNSLYTSTRTLRMEFENDGGVPALRSYKIEGFQKIVMGDSVYFSIEGEVF